MAAIMKVVYGNTLRQASHLEGGEEGARVYVPQKGCIYDQRYKSHIQCTFCTIQFRQYLIEKSIKSCCHLKVETHVFWVVNGRQVNLQRETGIQQKLNYMIS